MMPAGEGLPPSNQIPPLRGRVLRELAAIEPGHTLTVAAEPHVALYVLEDGTMPLFNARRYGVAGVLHEATAMMKMARVPRREVDMFRTDTEGGS